MKILKPIMGVATPVASTALPRLASSPPSNSPAPILSRSTTSPFVALAVADEAVRESPGRAHDLPRHRRGRKTPLRRRHPPHGATGRRRRQIGAVAGSPCAQIGWSGAREVAQIVAQIAPPLALSFARIALFLARLPSLFFHGVKGWKEIFWERVHSYASLTPRYVPAKSERGTRSIVGGRRRR